MSKPHIWLTKIATAGRLADHLSPAGGSRGGAITLGTQAPMSMMWGGGAMIRLTVLMTSTGATEDQDHLRGISSIAA
jgi:hypothetical protein